MIKSKMFLALKITKLFTFGLTLLLISCNNTNPSSSKEDHVQSFDNKGHEFVYKMVKKVGTYQDLQTKKDVSYTYTYTTPDGKQDVSNEKYIFEGELSYGLYRKHERTMSDLEGQIEQGYDGSTYWLKHNGKNIEDSTLLKRVAFNRPTNFYWFAMMQKLLDPGLSYEYIGERKVNDNNYDIVKVTFASNDNTPKDIYQLFINKKTSLVDQFLFTVADFGVIEKPLLMQVLYEEVDGLLLPTKRKYKSSTWDAAVSEDPWINVVWSDIKFNNNLTKEIFSKHAINN